MIQLTEVLEDFWDSRLEEIHTAFPAIVQSYSGHKTRTVTVVPATNLMLSNGTILHTIPISNIPVMFPSSNAGGFVFPLKTGDMVMVVVSETALGNWIAGSGAVCDPEHSSRFNMGDGVAIPGLWTSQSNPKVTVPDSSAQIVFNKASVEFKKNGKFSISNEVCSAKTLLDDSWEQINGIVTDLNNFLTPLSLNPAPTLGTAFAPLVTTLTARLASIATGMQKVKTLLD